MYWTFQDVGQDFLLSSQLALVVPYQALFHDLADVSIAMEEQVAIRIEETQMACSSSATEQMLVVDLVEVGAEACQVPNHSDWVNEWLNALKARLFRFLLLKLLFEQLVV